MDHRLKDNPKAKSASQICAKRCRHILQQQENPVEQQQICCNQQTAYKHPILLDGYGENTVGIDLGRAPEDGGTRAVDRKNPSSGDRALHQHILTDVVDLLIGHMGKTGVKILGLVLVKETLHTRMDGLETVERTDAETAGGDQKYEYGCKNTGFILCTLDGINIDTNMRAIDTEGNVIPGLYVNGNDSGGYFANTYPNLSTGMACGRTVTFGYLLGKTLSGAFENAADVEIVPENIPVAAPEGETEAVTE